MFLWCYLYYNDKAVYGVWLRIAVAGARHVSCQIRMFVFSKMEANSYECPAPKELRIQLPSIEYVLVEQTSCYVIVCEDKNHTEPLYCICTYVLQKHMFFLNLIWLGLKLVD